MKTDFIYSALAQELGLVGVAALLLVFMVFVARGMKIALQVDDGFSKLLAAGLTFGFALQTFVIVGGILRIIPLTGITLPFVSYGGSSIVANFLLLAGLLLVSNRANASREQADLTRRDRRPRAARLADRRDDLLADVGLAGTRRAAGQRDPAGRAVPIDRGLIYAPNGKTVLAANVRKKSTGGTLYFRTYPTNGLASQVVGYSTQSRSRAGRRAAENSYLTGSNADLGTIFATVGDRLKGTTIKGNNLVLTIRPARSGSPSSLLAGKCGAAVVLNPQDGRRLRDGLDAGLRPEPDREADRLRADAGDEEPVPARAGVAAPEPRDAGPLSRRARPSRRSPPRRRSTTASTRRTRRFDDPGYCTEYGKQVKNALDQSGPEAFGIVNLVEAYQHSINAVFCNIGKKLGAKRILDEAKKFGFYSVPPLETPSSDASASGLYASTASSSTRRRARVLARRPGPARLRAGQDADDAAADGDGRGGGREQRRRDEADADQGGDLARAARSIDGCTRTCCGRRRSPRPPAR